MKSKNTAKGNKQISLMFAGFFGVLLVIILLRLFFLNVEFSAEQSSQTLTFQEKALSILGVNLEKTTQPTILEFSLEEETLLIAEQGDNTIFYQLENPAQQLAKVPGTELSNAKLTDTKQLFAINDSQILLDQEVLLETENSISDYILIDSEAFLLVNSGRKQDLLLVKNWSQAHIVKEFPILDDEEFTFLDPTIANQTSNTISLMKAGQCYSFAVIERELTEIDCPTGQSSITAKPIEEVVNDQELGQARLTIAEQEYLISDFTVSNIFVLKEQILISGKSYTSGIVEVYYWDPELDVAELPIVEIDSTEGAVPKKVIMQDNQLFLIAGTPIGDRLYTLIKVVPDSYMAPLVWQSITPNECVLQSCILDFTQ